MPASSKIVGEARNCREVIRFFSNAALNEFWRVFILNVSAEVVSGVEDAVPQFFKIVPFNRIFLPVVFELTYFLGIKKPVEN